MYFVKRHGWGIGLPVLLVVLALVIHAGVITLDDVPLSRDQVREIVAFLALIIFIWGSSRSNWLTDRPLVSKLRWFGILAFLSWGALRLMVLRARMFDIFTGFDVITMMSLVGAVIITVWMLLLVKDLIFIQQGKHTKWRFSGLLMIIYVYMIYNLSMGNTNAFTIPIDRYESVTFPVHSIFLGLLGLFSVVNGFRCKWIHYLNKSQKVGTFFFGAVVYAAILLQFLRQTRSVEESHFIAGTWINSVLFFFVIYTGMALLGILFQLPSAGLMDRRRKELRVLQSLSNAIGSVLEMKELVSKTTKLSREMVNADYTWLELKEDDAYRVVSTDGIAAEDVTALPDDVRDELFDRIQSEEILLLNDILRDKSLRKLRGWKKKAGSLLASSIRFKQKELGVLYAVKSDRFAFPEETRGLLQSFSDQVAVALENVHLVEKTIEQEVYHEELRLAHESQMRLLPVEMPEVDGAELDAMCVTANEIGGDFYDVIRVGEDRIDLVVGDVSGIGASAAFYMAELKGVISALAPHFHSPKQMLLDINIFMQKHFESDTFATMVYAMYTPSKRHMRLVRAGHPPAGLIREDVVSWLETGGIGLGLAENDVFGKSLKEKVVRLKRGDGLFLYTDGLIEARNKDEEEFGEDALTSQLSSLTGKSAREVMEHIHRQMESFTQGEPKHDDVTILVLRAT